MELPALTLGTAGHIDHGKTALVEALTGKSTDRLEEERRRGISIELGFAELALPGGRALSVVDVPGHERFVRTMVAGATGIDLFLMVIAADDGVMPQTREHLAVLRALGVEAGVVAVTKSDLVDGEALELACQEAGELMPGCEIVPVSARTRTGLDELLAALGRSVSKVTSRAGAAAGDGAVPAVLHVDRSFTLKGIGTVVTGTLRSGRFTTGDSVELLPQHETARIRSIQVHDRPVDEATAGSRAALNLTGVGWRDVARGDVIASADSDLEPTYRIDTTLSPEARARLRPNERLTVHHGTREAPARYVPLADDTGLCQLRLESPLMPRTGDRFVLRRIAPPDTLGGGEVIDPKPRRKSGSERHPADTPVPPPQSSDPLPNAPTPAPQPLSPTALDALALLEADGIAPRAPQAIADTLGISRRDALAALDQLVTADRAVRIARDIYYAPQPLASARDQLVPLAAGSGGVTLSQARDALGTSRKYAQALLEHLDATKVTLRRDDTHVLRRAHQSQSPAHDREEAR